MRVYDVTFVTNLGKQRAEMSASDEVACKATLINVIRESSEHTEVLLHYSVNGYRNAVTVEEIGGIFQYLPVQS